MRKCKQYADVHLLQASRKFSKTFNNIELELSKESDAQPLGLSKYQIQKHRAWKITCPSPRGHQQPTATGSADAAAARAAAGAGTGSTGSNTPPGARRDLPSELHVLTLTQVSLSIPAESTQMKHLLAYIAEVILWIHEYNFLHIPPNFNLRSLCNRKQSLSQQASEAFF